ncbi:unnamed protein product [Urochloa humidicola]
MLAGAVVAMESPRALTMRHYLPCLVDWSRCLVEVVEMTEGAAAVQLPISIKGSRSSRCPVEVAEMMEGAAAVQLPIGIKGSRSVSLSRYLLEKLQTTFKGTSEQCTRMHVFLYQPQDLQYHGLSMEQGGTHSN